MSKKVLAVVLVATVVFLYVMKLTLLEQQTVSYRIVSERPARFSDVSGRSAV